MRGKWTRNDDVSDGHSVKNKYVFDEPSFRPKLLNNSPSLRAIRTYNELHVDGNFQDGIDVSVFQRRSSHPGRYDAASVISKDSLATNPVSDATENHLYDYATVGTYSMTNSGSELNSDLNESGSTVRLVATKMELSCQTWCSYLSTTLCTACMAAGIGNLYRLPQSALIRGGLPFLIVHIILTLFIGLPLLFLELGIGQLAQEGLIKSSRAVPFFKGIGYVKLVAGCLLSIYYPLYMGMSVFYITWILQGPLPFQECSSRVTITENGYSSVGKRGQQCLRETFLKPPLTNPYWYGIFAGFLLIVWILIAVLSIRKTKSYTRSLLILFLPTLAVYMALLVKSIILQNEFDSLSEFFYEADWTLLTSAGVWYFACIQVFFSTNVGFGSFVTNAGIMYNKVNPFWTAIGYIFVNILFGSGSVIISQSLTGTILNGTGLKLNAANGDIAELYLASFIYDFGSNSRSPNIKTWTVLAFCLFLLAGFINMATLTYTLFKAITVQSRKKLKWWHVSIIVSFLLYILGCAVLLQPDFDLVHLLDHYIVGNLILISTVIEVLALISFYGIERIRSDFEFMLGHILSRVWLVLWWASPILLTGIFAWGMTTLPLEGIYKDDPAWMYGIGWGVVLCATIFIFVVGAYVVSQQDGYTLKDKLAASVKPSKNWGPKDPMSRHNWIQWNTKAQQGERDFTLKRKGTKDYTRSVKRSKKLANSELSTSSLPGVYKENSKLTRPHSNGSSIYNEVSNVNTISRRIDDNFNLNGLSPMNTIDLNHYHSQTIPIPNVIRSNNPLSHNTIFLNGSTPDEYGTFRKGPYIINDNVEHVCFRKYSEGEEATEL